MEDSTTPWYTRVARFFGSFLGLLIILAAYTIGGIIIFICKPFSYVESKIKVEIFL